MKTYRIKHLRRVQSVFIRFVGHPIGSRTAHSRDSIISTTTNCIKKFNGFYPFFLLLHYSTEQEIHDDAPDSLSMLVDFSTGRIKMVLFLPLYSFFTINLLTIYDNIVKLFIVT